MLRRRSRLTVLLILVCLAGGVGQRALAGAPDEARERALCARVVSSPCMLAAAVEQASARGRIALDATFELDEADVLSIHVTTVGPAGEATDYERLTGRVNEECWAPWRKPLIDSVDVARAARGQTLLAQTQTTLGHALVQLASAQRPAKGSLSGVPLSIRPSLVAGKPTFVGRASIEGAPWEVTQDFASGRALELRPPEYVKAQEEAARRWLGRRLPELDVQGARWLNVEVQPTLKGWKGHPVLVVLTNYNCELECGPGPAVVSAWERRYGPLGLKVLTIYRDKVSWKQEVALEGLPEHVRTSKTEHPVMLDVLDRYIEALEPGPTGYPMVFLLDREGLVAWESGTDRLDFPERCEGALRSAFAATPRPPGPQASGR